MILFVLGLLGGLLGIGGVSEVRHQERLAADEFHERLGPSAKVRVRFKLSGIASLQGDLAGVSVRARDFAIDGLPLYVDPSVPHDGRIKSLEVHLEHGTARGFALDRLEVTLPEVRYDYHAAQKKRGFLLSSCGDGTFRVEVSEATAALGASKKNPSVSGAKVILADDRMVVDATVKSSFGSIPVHIEGHLAARSGHLVVLEDPSVILAGKSVGPDSAAPILALVNPLMDLDKDFSQPGVLRILAVSARDHKLVISGAVRLPTKPILECGGPPPLCIPQACERLAEVVTR